MENAFKKYEDAAVVSMNKSNGGFTESSFNELLDKNFSFENGSSSKEHTFNDTYRLALTDKTIVISTLINEKEFRIYIKNTESCNQLLSECDWTLEDEVVTYDPHSLLHSLNISASNDIEFIINQTYHDRQDIEVVYPNDVVIVKTMSGQFNTSDFTSGGSLLTSNKHTVTMEGVHTFYFEKQNGDKFVKMFHAKFSEPKELVIIADVDNKWGDSVTANISVKNAPSSDVTLKWDIGELTKSHFTNNGNLIVGNSFTVDVNGTYTVFALSADGRSAIKTIVIDNVDTSQPTATISTNPIYNAISKHNPVRLTANDIGSGIKTIEYAWGNSSDFVSLLDSPNPVFTYNNEIKLPHTPQVSGVYSLKIRMTDFAGNSVVRSFSPRVDNIPPNIVLAFDPEYDSIYIDNYDGALSNSLKFDVGFKIVDHFRNKGMPFDYEILINKNQTYSVYGYDSAGNEGVGIIEITELPDYNLEPDFIFDKHMIKSYIGSASEVHLPKNLNYKAISTLGFESFSNKNLTSVIISNGITRIESRAFYDNEITNATLPNSIKSLGDSSFYKNNLTSISIPSGISEIAAYTFSANDLTSLDIPNGVVRIRDHAFSDNSIKELSLPNSLAYIDKHAFARSNIENLSIPNGVKEISSSAFVSNKITTLSLPNGLEKMGGSAFEGNAITSVILPPTLTSLGDGVFRRNKIKSISLPESLTEIGVHVFDTNEITTYSLPSNMTTIPNYFLANNKITSLTLPSSVASIGSYSFLGNNFSTLHIPNSVNSIGVLAFGKNDLVSIYIPSSVQKILSGAFRYSTYTSPINVTNCSNVTLSDHFDRTPIISTTGC